MRYKYYKVTRLVVELAQESPIAGGGGGCILAKESYVLAAGSARTLKSKFRGNIGKLAAGQTY